MANKLFCRAYQKVMKIGTMLLPWKFPTIVSGAGSIKKLPAIVKNNGVNNVLIVTDTGLVKLGLLNSLYEGLEAVDVKYTVFDGVQPNPTIDNIEDARKMYLDNKCEGFIAFGGGSPMDCAKVTAARIVRPNKTIPELRGQLKVLRKIPPFFAVPTTAGTGSETTIAAVVSNPKTHEKNAINDICLLPDYAILDPELTIGLPKHITSTTGMDALTHAVEAYIGQSNTKNTEEKAKEATALIFKYLKRAYDDGKDIEAREKMLLASHYAGIAFTRAYVGYVHAIAHNLGGTYGTPHGLANAVILPYVLDYFGETAYKRLADLADVVGIKADGTIEGKAKAFIAEIRAMNEYMGIPKGFDFIQEKDIPTIVERALKEANPLYPVPKIMDEKDCEGVIRNLMI
jgi:alcohol dehydrogenase class IV